MDRQIVYPGAIPLETDLLNTNRNALVGLGKLAAAVLGAGTVVNGLACTPTAPASMQVQVAPGEIYSLQNLDNTAYSSLPADTTDQIVKQGITLTTTTLNCPAPTTNGYSINYLVEATYQDVDTGATTLPYYNASNPSQAYSGPANSGATQNTARKGVCNVTVKAGVATTTGAQVTPAPDSGYVGLWVVTVAYGQTTIASGNISAYPGAPFVNNTLLGQNPAFGVSPTAPTPAQFDNSQKVATTAFVQANQQMFSGISVLTAASALTATVADFLFEITGAASYTTALPAGSSTIAGSVFTFVNYSPALQTVTTSGTDFIPLAGVNVSSMTLRPGDNLLLVYRAAGEWDVVGGTAALPYAGTAQALAPEVGAMRNLKMSVTTASATATMTADEVITKSALGGTSVCVANLNASVNLATTGAGGMDTGTAPASGYVGIYVIYNPTTQTKALLAVNATSAAVGNVYGGANMPAGYTMSALVSVWPTNASRQFIVSAQNDRKIAITSVTVLSSTAATALASLSIAGAVPPNARNCAGSVNLGSNASTITGAQIASSAGQIGNQIIQGGTATAVFSQLVAPCSVEIITPQTIWYSYVFTGGTANSINIYLTSYTI